MTSFLVSTIILFFVSRQERLVGEGDVQQLDRPRNNADGANFRVGGSPEDADRDLPPVGDENLLEHGSALFAPSTCRSAHRRARGLRSGRGGAVLNSPGATTGRPPSSASAMTTDWLDGRLARRQGRTSSVGSLLDPIADKVLVLAALVMLVGEGVVQAWMVAAIVVREVLITGLRQAAIERGVVLAARDLGKLKTWAQAVARPPWGDSPRQAPGRIAQPGGRCSWPSS